MGLAKRMMMEEQERGYSSVGEKCVCAECFIDDGVRRFVRQNAQNRQCSYCHRESTEPIAAPVDDVIGFIVGCIEKEYDIPENELPWDGREGGWQGETIDTWDLLNEMELVEEDGDLLDDIRSAINGQRDTWCKRDAFGMRENEIAMASWERFKWLTMHRCRYVFFRMERPPADACDHWDQFIDPLGILDRIGNLINHHSLLATLPVGTEVCRVRLHRDEHFDSIDELGPPPREGAVYANRMSPAGIPMFYAAGDADTAVSETWDQRGQPYCSLGVFSLIRECRIVDLVAIPPVPSLTDEGRDGDREDLRFLHQFVHDAARPIEKTDKAHIDYTPTQVVAEYIRHVFREEGGNPVQGIAYRSAKTGRKSYVFFWGHLDDKYTNPEVIGKWCRLDRVQHRKLTSSRPGQSGATNGENSSGVVHE